MVKTSWLDNTVLSIAPIPLDDLKEYFANKLLKFLINYENSTLKGDKFLTYLSNLDVPCDVIFSDKDKDSIFELVKEYMNTRMLVKLPTLEVITLQILLASKGIDNGLYYDNKLFSIAELKAFAEQNKDLVNKWLVALASGSLFNLHCINDDKIKNSLNDFEKIEDDQFCGINYANLYKYEELYEVFPLISLEDRKFLVKQFTEPMFKGESLYNYWFVPGNVVALITESVSVGLWDNDKYLKAKEESVKNVPTV